MMEDMTVRSAQALELDSETMVDQVYATDLLASDEELQANAKRLVLTFSHLKLSSADKDIDMANDEETTADKNDAHAKVVLRQNSGQCVCVSVARAHAHNPLSNPRVVMKPYVARINSFTVKNP